MIAVQVRPNEWVAIRDCGHVCSYHSGGSLMGDRGPFVYERCCRCDHATMMRGLCPVCRVRPASVTTTTHNH